MGEINLSEFYNTEVKHCLLGRRLLTLLKEDIAKWEVALTTPDISALALQKWLATKNITISHEQILRHRRGSCRCDRP